MGKTETINPRRARIIEGELTMLRKLTLALVAAASLSAMALAPTAASAKPWGGGWGGGFGGGWGFHHHHFGHGFGIGYIGGGDDGCYVTREVMTQFGPRLRTVNVCY
jgi:hypothetical protein